MTAFKACTGHWKPIFRIAVLCFCVIAPPLSAGTPTVTKLQSTSRDYVLWYRNFDSPAIRALVELALQKTSEYGDFQVIRSEALSQGRALRELTIGQSHLVDIANVATSAERESVMIAIPFPVDGGLLGFRVCVVLPESLPKFANIENLEDFRASEVRIGQGAHWPDADVLGANGIPVVSHSRYEILFRMLQKERFECFARGVSEVLYDLEMEQNPDLVIEPNLLIAYPMPSYLFVAPDDQETAHRLQLGIERAIYDGSFSDFLESYYARAVKDLNLEQRVVIALENPLLSEESRNVGHRTLENLRRRLNILSR